MQELKIKPIPQYALDALMQMPFQGELGRMERTCVVYIHEDDAVSRIHPESFDVCEVYGNCELKQAIVGEQTTPIVLSKYQFYKDSRSFDEAAFRSFVA